MQQLSLLPSLFFPHTEQRCHEGSITWEVTRVVRADLQEQMKELEVRLKEEQEKRTSAERELEQRLREEQEKRAETERCMQLLEKRVTGKKLGVCAYVCVLCFGCQLL